MPGYELLGREELDLIHTVFDSGAVLLRHGFDSIRSGIYMTDDFEAEFAAQVNGGHALAVSSATAGLKVALRALGIGPGDEVITQAFTFIATVEAIIESGATPVVVDIDETLTMDPQALAGAITGRTRAIIPVHMLGVPADMPAIMQVAEAVGVPVIEDAAEALGARIGGRDVGTWGLCGVYSFGYQKTITTGEGGMLVSGDGDFLTRARHYHDHGHVNDPALARGEDRWDGLGFNFRMSEVNAAIGLAQLRKLERIVAANTRNAAYLIDQLGPSLAPLHRRMPSGSQPLNDCLVLQIPSAQMATKVATDMISAGFAPKNLPTALRWHFARYWSHLLAPFDAAAPEAAGGFPVSARHLERSVALPVQVGSTPDELDALARCVRRCLATAMAGEE